MGEQITLWNGWTLANEEVAVVANKEFQAQNRNHIFKILTIEVYAMKKFHGNMVREKEEEDAGKVKKKNEIYFVAFLL